MRAPYNDEIDILDGEANKFQKLAKNILGGNDNFGGGSKENNYQIDKRFSNMDILPSLPDFTMNET